LAAGGDGEPVEEVRPAGGVAGGLVGWQAAVFDGHPRAGGDRGEGDLDSTGRFAVESADGHARVVWESSLVPADPADPVGQMWEPHLPVILGNLKRLVEGP
jgi:hypothetical protein